MEPAHDLCLVLRTHKWGNCPVLNWNDGLLWGLQREVTTGAVDTSRWLVIYEFSRVIGRQSTDGGELLEMVITADEWSCEVIQEQE